MSSIYIQGRIALLCAAVGVVLCACSDDDAAIPARADSGFTMAANAFSFENFADGYVESRMNANLVVRMFGAEAACVDPAAAACALTPAARTWMNRVNASMDGGRCEGFVVLSELLYLKAIDAASFGGDSARKLSLDGNLALQQELAYWFATQNVPSVSGAKAQKFLGRDALRFMATFLKPDAPEFYRIGIVRKTKNGISGGHAVTPIRYSETDVKGVYALHVYDNNFPDQDRVITIDANKNRWEYRASANPDEESALYYGDEGNRNPLYFAPVKSRVGTLPSPFGKGATESQTVFQGAVQVKAASGASAAGIGPDGEPVETGDGKVIPSFSALNTWDNSAPVTIVLPSGEASFDVKGTDDTKLRATQIVHVGDGFTVTADNLAVTPGMTDTFKVAQNGQSSTYTNTSGTPVMMTTTVGNYVVSVALTGPSTNVVANVDPQTGKIVLVTDGTANGAIDIAVTKGDSGGSDRLTIGGANTSTATLDASKLAPGKRLAGTQDTGNGPFPIGDSCSDDVKDNDEEGVDCGGSCPFLCSGPTCTDSARNGNETDTDCGGSCTTCADGLKCNQNGDCASAFCELGICGSRDRVVFLSSSTSTAVLGGLTGADATCQALATNARLRGTFKAFLSSNASDAATRLTRGTARYVLVDGTVVANDAAGFFSDTHLAGISQTELGGGISAYAWTASNGAGVNGGLSTCSQWTETGEARSTAGSSVATNAQWANAGTDPSCIELLHLYCVQQ